MSKHTPGPWFIRPQPGYGEDQIGATDFCICDIDYIAHERRSVADVGEYSESKVGLRNRKANPGEIEANAQLIALAPEMYEYIHSSAMAGCATAKVLLAKLS